MLMSLRRYIEITRMARLTSDRQRDERLRVFSNLLRIDVAAIFVDDR
jgi:hypothetical protein